MKKLFLVLAVVAVYAFSITAASASVLVSEKAQITVVADDNNDNEAKKENKKEAKKAEAKGAACGEKTEAKAGCGEAEKKACGTAAKSEAKGAACGDKK
jgi:chromatin remodeling complex protein RSC6